MRMSNKLLKFSQCLSEQVNAPAAGLAGILHLKKQLIFII